MSRPRKPVEALKLAGTFRKDRHGERDGELELTPLIPTAPEWLSVAAKAEWDRVTGDPEYAKAITLADRGMLTLYVSLWGELETAAAEGKTLQTSRLALFTSVCARLGFDPQSRCKIKVTPTKERNTFDELKAEGKELQRPN